MKKIYFRCWGAIFLIVGLICSFRPTMFLPQSFGWRGDFELSDAGQIFHGITMIGGNFFLIGLLMIVLSYTTLVEADPAGAAEESEF